METENDSGKIHARNKPFYIAQVAKLLPPIFLTIWLTVIWVKLTSPQSAYYGSGYLPVQISSPIGNAFGSHNNQSDLNSLYIALIIIAQITFSTVIIASLFKCGKGQYVFYFIGFVVVGLLGFFGYTLSIDLLKSFNVNLDYFTLIILVWNFLV
jgi:hypothetical protein